MFGAVSGGTACVSVETSGVRGGAARIVSGPDALLPRRSGMLFPARLGRPPGGCLDSFQIPRLTTMARTALPNLIEGTLLPLGLFYAAMWAIGLWGAIAISLAWSWGAVAVRLVRGRRSVPA